MICTRMLFLSLLPFLLPTSLTLFARGGQAFCWQLDLHPGITKKPRVTQRTINQAGTKHFVFVY